MKILKQLVQTERIAVVNVGLWGTEMWYSNTIKT